MFMFIDVPGNEALLAVRADGAVLRKARDTPGGELPAMLLKPRMQGGRLVVRPTVDGKRREFGVGALLRAVFGAEAAPVKRGGKPRKPVIRRFAERVEPVGKGREVPGAAGYTVFENGAVVGPTGLALVQKYRKNKPYRQVALRVSGKQIYRLVHCIVLEAFVGPRPPGMVACHGLWGAEENSVRNLRWDTPEANVQDRVAMRKLRATGLW